MKAVKTKAGTWKARYVDHYEYVEGKRKIVLGTVTCNTKREAIKEATRLEGLGKKGSAIRISDALQRYIRAKEPILSPSTIRAYRALADNAYDSISTITLSEATGERLQAWVSEYSADHAPKAVRNAYALLSASVKMFAPSVDVSVTLPRPKPPRLYTPTDDDIKRLLAYVRGTEMEKAIILASFGLRRGEVCALTYDDIIGNTVRVTKAIVEKPGGGTAVKQPKTTQSVRSVTLPESAIRILRRCSSPGSRIVQLTPAAISNAFPRILRECGLPPFRFHDLRAYFASVRHALGVPDQYIMQAGGWKSPHVLQTVYRRTMSDKATEFDRIANSHFEAMLG